MTYDWVVLQTLIFIVTPFFVMLALARDDDDNDNDGPGGGMLQPAHVTNP